ncbi:MAG: hypothetical protein ABI986_10330 [Chloroflexota bacterium]
MIIPTDILDLWQQHSSAPFPKGYMGKAINGIDLPLVDAEIAGCIHKYINSARLDSQILKTLRERLVDLNTMVLLLDSEELIYFNRLRDLANRVLQEVGNM